MRWARRGRALLSAATFYRSCSKTSSEKRQESWTQQGQSETHRQTALSMSRTSCARIRVSHCSSKSLDGRLLERTTSQGGTPENSKIHQLVVSWATVLYVSAPFPPDFWAAELTLLQTGNLASQPDSLPDTLLGDAWANEMSWAPPPPGWADMSWPPALFDMVLASDRATPQAWSTPFGLGELSGPWDQPR